MRKRLTIGKADPWSAAVALPLSKGGSHTPALRRCLSAHFLRIYSVNPSMQNANSKLSCRRQIRRGGKNAKLLRILFLNFAICTLHFTTFNDI